VNQTQRYVSPDGVHHRLWEFRFKVAVSAVGRHFHLYSSMGAGTKVIAT